jgi:dienelactone hydrolase
VTAAGVAHQIVIYDDAPHSLFDRKQDDYAEASDDAWERTARVHREARRELTILR